MSRKKQNFEEKKKKKKYTNKIEYISSQTKQIQHIRVHKETQKTHNTHGRKVRPALIPLNVTPSTPHIYINKGIKIQILIKSIFKTFLNTSFSNG